MSVHIPAHLDLEARDARARAVHATRLPARDAEAHALLGRGFPNLVVVTDERPRSALSAARKRLCAIDPVHPQQVPREVAIRWLHAFAGGANPFGATVDEDLGRTDAPDASLLRTLLERGLTSTAGYPFAHADAVWTFEALLGADAVVATFTEVLRAAPQEVWQLPSPNVRSLAHATALGWVLLRASPAVVPDALAALAEARAPAGEGRPATLARAVDVVLGRTLPDLGSEPERRWRVIHLSDDLAAARVRHPWRLWITDPQDAWVTGTEPPAWALARLAAEPRWLAQYLLDRWAPLATPFTGALGATIGALPRKLSRKELTREVRALCDHLAADLSTVRGDATAEARVLGGAALALVTLRARGGEELPEAHVGHILAVDGWDKQTSPPLTRLASPTPEEWSRWLAVLEATLG